MNSSDFTDPSTGELVRTPDGAFAFVPAPLPPALDIAELVIPLANAIQAIGELKGACRRLSNPYILIGPLQRSEALTSSAIEGTFTTDDELILAEAGLDKQSTEETKEVINYIYAINTALSMLKELPL